MHQDFQACMTALFDEQPLPQSSLEGAVKLMFAGSASPVEIAALLTALKLRGEHTNEMVTIARLMHEFMSPIPVQNHDLLDTCGTGGDNMHTFNISTAVAIVAAGAGVKVAKHGNRSVSSTSGSADVLETMGINVQLSPQEVARCIEEIGIGFCFAPLFHSAMKHLATVRKELGFRTIFNLLGPLTNPAKAHYQLIGASRNDFAEKIAHAKSAFPHKRCLVVCGNNELDEVALWGKTIVHKIEASKITTLTLTAQDFGLNEVSPKDLIVNSPQESAEVINQIMNGQITSARSIVVANTACALPACGKTNDLKSGVKLAEESLDSGKAREILIRLENFKCT